MKLAKLASMLVLGVAVVAGSVMTLDSAQLRGQEIAARYHLRQRTQRFFERSTPSGREAQQGIYQTLPAPAQQRANCSTKTVG